MHQILFKMSRLNIQILYKTLFFILVSSQISIAQQGNIKVEQDAKLPQLLEKRIDMSKNNELGERFKIQLYYGNNQKASNTITSFRSKFGEWPSEVVYETPNYKVWVGNFRNKLEADRALLKIKEQFPSAFIFKPERG